MVIPLNGPSTARLLGFLGSGSDRSAALCVCPSWLATEREDKVRQALLLACLQRYNWLRGSLPEDAPGVDRLQEVLSGLGLWVQQVLAGRNARHPPTDNLSAWERAAEKLLTQETLVFYPLAPPRLPELREGEKLNEAAARYWTAIEDAVRQCRPAPADAGDTQQQGRDTDLTVALASPLGTDGVREVVTLTPGSARRFPFRCSDSKGRTITSLHLCGFPLAFKALSSSFVLTEQNTLRKLRLSQMEVTGKGSMKFQRCTALEEFTLTKWTAGGDPAGVTLVFRRCPELQVIDISTGSSGPQPVLITLERQSRSILPKPGVSLPQLSTTEKHPELNVTISGCKSLRKLEAPALSMAELVDIDIVRGALPSVDLSGLCECKKDLSLTYQGAEPEDCNLVPVPDPAFTNLSNVGGLAEFKFERGHGLQMLQWPKLDKANKLDITCQDCKRLREARLPILSAAPLVLALKFIKCPKLTEVSVPGLEIAACDTTITLKECDRVTELCFPKLGKQNSPPAFAADAPGVWPRFEIRVVHCNKLNRLSLPALQTTSTHLTIAVSYCKKFESCLLPSLITCPPGEKVSFNFDDCKKFSLLDLPGTLAAGMLELDLQKCPKLLAVQLPNELKCDHVNLVLTKCNQSFQLHFPNNWSAQTGKAQKELKLKFVDCEELTIHANIPKNSLAVQKLWLAVKNCEGLKKLELPPWVAGCSKLVLEVTNCAKLESIVLPTCDGKPQVRIELDLDSCPLLKELVNEPSGYAQLSVEDCPCLEGTTLAWQEANR